MRYKNINNNIYQGEIMSLNKKCFKFLAIFIKKQKIRFCLLLLSCFVWAIANSSIPYFIKSALDKISVISIQKFTFHEFLLPCILLVTFCLLLEIGLRYQGFVFLKIFPTLQAQILKFTINQLKNKEYTFFEKFPLGNITTKLVEMPKSCEMLLTLIICNFTPIIISITLSIIITLSINYIFTMILLSWFILHISISLLFSKKASEMALENSIAHAKIQGKVTDIIKNINFVRNCNSFDFEEKRIEHEQKDWVIKSRSSLAMLEKVKAIQGLLSLLMMFPNSFLIFYYWKNSLISFGDVSLLFLMMFSIINLSWYMSQNISIFFREMSKLKSALILIDDLHETSSIIPKRKNTVRHSSHNNSIINLHDITYTKEGGDILFKNIFLALKKSEKIAILGKSGIGKSTLINIILQHYFPSSGHVVCNNDIHNNIVHIPQNQILFNRSITENIAYGFSSFNQKEIIKSSDIAHASNFINILPEKYDTVVGDSGSLLSGGQVQKILLARAVFRNAPFYIFDEPFSSLDKKSKEKLYYSLFKFLEDKTAIIISHDREIYNYVDKAYFLTKKQLRPI